MVLVVYRLVFAYIAVLLIWGVFDGRTLYEKMAYAFVAMPFIFRALLIK